MSEHSRKDDPGKRLARSQPAMMCAKRGLFVCVGCLIVCNLAATQNDLFVPANDVSFTISTDRSRYSYQEQINLKYRISNISDRSLFILRGFEVTACLGIGGPNVTYGFESSTGQHFRYGYGVSCASTPGAAAPKLIERLNKGAVLLHPGEHFEGTIALDPSVFKLTPGTYRIEATLHGWKDGQFNQAEQGELRKMGHPFLRGEVPTSIPVALTTGAARSKDGGTVGIGLGRKLSSLWPSLRAEGHDIFPGKRSPACQKPRLIARFLRGKGTTSLRPLRSMAGGIITSASRQTFHDPVNII
jgi:hypothetical protein